MKMLTETEARNRSGLISELKSHGYEVEGHEDADRIEISADKGFADYVIDISVTITRPAKDLQVTGWANRGDTGAVTRFSSFQEVLTFVRANIV